MKANESKAQMITAAAGAFGVALFGYSIATAESPPFAAEESPNTDAASDGKQAKASGESSCASCGSKDDKDDDDDGDSDDESVKSASVTAKTKNPKSDSEAACGAGKCA